MAKPKGACKFHDYEVHGRYYVCRKCGHTLTIVNGR
jgi:predicted SprT family Zn-dependent metalloprotease